MAVTNVLGELRSDTLAEPDKEVEVSIVVPTMRRQTLLRALVSRLLNQRGCEEISLELVIVDNCPQESARRVVAELQDKHGKEKIRYIAEKRPGVSHVRNTGIKAARGRLIGFIDDDETPCEEWLASLLECKLRFQADAVLGPVYPVFAAPDAGRDPFFRDAFTQSSERPTGARIEPKSPLRALFRPASCYRVMATNNALVDARYCRTEASVFNPALTYLGGEDVLFFHNLYLSGKKIVWCREAVVLETVPAERSELTYLLKRRFRNGQITSATCLLSTPRQYQRLAVSVGLGLLQLIMGAGLSMAYLLAGDRRARDALSTMAGGAGKVLWMRRLQGRNYGLGLEGVAP